MSPVVRTPATAEEWSASTRLLVDYFAWLGPMAGVESVTDAQPRACLEIEDLERVFGQAGYRFLTAFQGRLAVGTAGIVPSGDAGTAELVRFFSRPAARGSGVGTALLASAVGAARSLGYRRVVLDTVPRFMTPAIRLYERHGFARSADPHELPVPDGARFELQL